MEKEFPTGMRGNPTPATGQVSAALSIWAWILDHGRPPKVNECRNKNGLYGYDLYYRVFATSNFSSIIPLVSAICGSSVKMRTCLGWTHRGEDCPNTFPDQGAHVRLCDVCRRQTPRATEHEIAVDEHGQAGWNSLEPWAQDIDWGTSAGG